MDKLTKKRKLRVRIGGRDLEPWELPQEEFLGVEGSKCFDCLTIPVYDSGLCLECYKIFKADYEIDQMKWGVIDD